VIPSESLVDETFTIEIAIGITDCRLNDWVASNVITGGAGESIR
jgi:hypothetical protein